ncbi:hypothetical protein Dimus_023936 [Dionaea muscipula]
MGSDTIYPRVMDEDNESAVEEVDGSYSTTNKQGKVPKRRILKAEREKSKREQLNELFSKLAGVLEINEQNNGKACILCEAIKLINYMLSDIEVLRKDNAASLSEFEYLTAEKNELKDENSGLEAQIKNIRSEIDLRMSHSKPDLNLTPPECWEAGNFREDPLGFQAGDPVFQQPPFLCPVFVLAAAGPETVSRPPSNVSRPHARYPTSAESLGQKQILRTTKCSDSDSLAL